MPASRPDTRHSEGAVRDAVIRLSRPDGEGGAVIERAAILAEGSDAEAIIRWILAHSGRPEPVAPPAPARGLHGSRPALGGGAQPPPRYVLPAGALT